MFSFRGRIICTIVNDAELFCFNSVRCRFNNHLFPATPAGFPMIKKGKTGYSVFPPLIVAVLVLICLLLFLVPSLINSIIDLDTAISISIAVCLLTYAVIAVLYTKRFSVFTVSALFIGTLFYVNSAVCYTFGFSPLYFFLGRRFVCSWGLFPNQMNHGLAMMGLGLLIVIVGIRSLIVSKKGGHVEKILEYVFIGLGAIHLVTGMLALLSR